MAFVACLAVSSCLPHKLEQRVQIMNFKPGAPAKQFSDNSDTQPGEIVGGQYMPFQTWLNGD